MTLRIRCCLESGESLDFDRSVPVHLFAGVDVGRWKVSLQSAAFPWSGSAFRVEGGGQLERVAHSVLFDRARPLHVAPPCTHVPRIARVG
eukprot:6179748-Pleurochrysis_carterae.AAC.1